MKVRADRFDQVKSQMGEYMDVSELVPVDMRGRRVFLDKNDPNNLKNAAEDIQSYYDLVGPGEVV